MNTLFDNQDNEILSLKGASVWASEYLNKNVTESNISYLVQYGKIRKVESNGSTYIKKNDLKKYYDSYYGKRELDWKNKLGDDLDWHLSFDYLKEADTTKHVHRLHPYKGKFIPQLVEYFLDNHIDEFKRGVFFTKGDIVLDPFCGSGTTLVQANELGIHAIGIDVSEFNAMISNAKVSKYDLIKLSHCIRDITSTLKKFVNQSKVIAFEEALLQELNVFNSRHFPSPEFKIKVHRKEINEKEYTRQYENKFLPIYNRLIDEFGIDLKQGTQDSFIDKWYLKNVRDEIELVFEQIKKIEDKKIKVILAVILSRTIRSCRATTHSDLATLKEPVLTTYYCAKHGKICKPLFSIAKWWDTYTKDTLKRLSVFDGLRTNTYQYCISGDSRRLDVLAEIQKRNSSFYNLLKRQKIRGIFSSPPYVGLIDYHEQHAYAYDLFGFNRRDELEIGPLDKGQGREAREFYVQGIVDTLNHSKQYLTQDYDIFLVANDKYNLYPIIAERAGMKIVNRFRRPVLNRTERDKGAYSETIFHIKGL